MLSEFSMCILQWALHVTGIMTIEDSTPAYICVYRTDGQCVGAYILNLQNINTNSKSIFILRHDYDIVCVVTMCSIH